MICTALRSITVEASDLMRKTCLILPAIIMMSACSHREPLVSTPQLTVVESSHALPPPNRSDLTAADRPALIGPLDTIEVDVFNVPDLSREMQVDASGRIVMPVSYTHLTLPTKA